MWKLNQKLKPVFWEKMPAKSFFLFVLAVFFLFSSIGFVIDILNLGEVGVQKLVRNVLYCGLVATGFAYSFTKNIKMLPVTLIFQFGFFFLPWDTILPNDFTIDQATQLYIDGFGILSSIVISYTLFVIFISSQGIKQVRLRAEMDIAGEMHDVLVPPINFRNENLCIYGKSLPALEVGGDLIDLYEKDGSLTCYIADVSGHGISAGLLMGMFKSVFHVFLDENYSLSELLNNTNRILYRLKKRTMFITCACLRFEQQGKAEIITAGHLPVIHHRHNKNEINHLVKKQIPVASLINISFHSEKITYGSGDVFVLISDGTIEVLDKKGQQFGQDRIDRIIAENSDKEPEMIYRALSDEIKRFGKQTDDQSIIIIKCL